jgi:hypothetical protein
MAKILSDLGLLKREGWPLMFRNANASGEFSKAAVIDADATIPMADSTNACLNA